MKTPWVLVLAIVLSTSTAYGYTITVGTPGRGGFDTFTVMDIFGRELRVMVLLDGTEDDKKKAGRLANALVTNGVRATAEGNSVVSNEVRSVELKKGDNTTGEKVKVSSTNPFSAYIGYSGSITGLDLQGNPSIFQASLGIADLIVSSDLSFAALSNPTLDGLLTDTFSQLRAGLPLALQSRLALDLENDLIAFTFPDNASTGFVENFTSDSATQITLGLAATVSEPATLLTLGVAALGLLGYACRNRAKEPARIRS